MTSSTVTRAGHLAREIELERESFRSDRHAHLHFERYPVGEPPQIAFDPPQSPQQTEHRGLVIAQIVVAVSLVALGVIEWMWVMREIHP